MPSMFRDFAKKAFNTTKSFVKKTVDRFKSAPKYPEARSSRMIRPSQQDRINAGFYKINRFMQRGIERSEPPLRPQKDRSNVTYRSNHAPKIRQPLRFFFRLGDAGYRMGSDGKSHPIPYSRKLVRA